MLFNLHPHFSVPLTNLFSAYAPTFKLTGGWKALLGCLLLIAAVSPTRAPAAPPGPRGRRGRGGLDDKQPNVFLGRLENGDGVLMADVCQVRIVHLPATRFLNLYPPQLV